MSARPRREKKSKVDLSAIEALGDARKGGSKRVEQFHLKEAQSIYEEVDEEEYTKIVAKRRQDDFVEEDGEDLGYKDDGEEAWNRQESSDDEYEENKHAASKFGMTTAREPVKKEKEVKGMQKISQLLTKQAQTAKRGPTGESGLGALESVGTKRKSEAVSSIKSSSSKVNVSVDDLLSGLTTTTSAKPKSSQPKKKQNAFSGSSAGGGISSFMSPMDSKKKPTVPQRKKILSGASNSSFMSMVKQEPVEDEMMVEHNEPPQEDEEMDVPVKDEMKEEDVDSPERKTGGFARDPKDDARGNRESLKALSEQDDWRAMRAEAGDMDAQEEEEEVKTEEVKTEASAGNTASGDCKIPTKEDGSFDMFWIDAFEDQSKPGRIFVIGKVKMDDDLFGSCCLQIEHVQRQAFILPREKLLDNEGNETEDEVSMTKHVWPEFKHLATKHGIKHHKCKPVERNYMYHFQDVGIPEKAKYLKVVYSAEYPALASDLAGRSFKRVFGGSQSCMELFLLKRDLMGPCWLNVKAATPTKAPFSWCKCEMQTADPKSVTRIASNPPESPPLCVLSLHMHTVKNEREHSNEIAMISALCHPEVCVEGPTDKPERKFFGFTAVRKLEGAAWPIDIQQKVEEYNKGNKHSPRYIHANERSLLNFLLAKIHSIDPDVIVGHNFVGFDLDVLLHRMQRIKIPGWSKLGRLRRSQMPKLQANAGGMGQSTWAEKAVMSGRLMCDTYIAAKENLRETTYTLGELTRTQLGKERQEIDFQQIPQFFTRTSELMKLLSHNENDTYLCLQLMFKLMILPLTKQLTGLAGNLWSRSLLSARAERVEYLLLHEFHRLKFVMPDKAQFNNKKGGAIGGAEHGEEGEEGEGGEEGAGESKKWSKRKKAAYAGGLVLEPKRGLYDKHILLLDFNSLYPTIIQEFNICFTTVAPAIEGGEGEPPRFELPDKEGKPGILPRVIKTLVDRRKTVKELIKKESNPVVKQQYDIRQSALKIMANSMYGCLGFTFSRFYAKPLAQMITSQGRELLQKTVEVTQNKLNLDVVYGDTDSIFVNSGCDNIKDATRVAAETRRELNKMWRLLEVGLDGIYCPLLLLNKKKYAALAVTERDGVVTKVKERKGLDIVRRDWCALAKRVGDKILDFILSGDAVDEVVNSIHSFLRSIAEDMEHDRLQLSEFIITKGLTKEPEEYSDAKTQAHVQVALKMKKKGIAVRAGDHVPYVITKDDSVSSFAQRAYDPDAVRQANGELALDKKWYMESQLHPVVSRICAVIEGTDSGRLAECLGLEASKFHKPEATGRSDRVSIFSEQAAEVDRFANVEKLIGMCSDGLAREFKGAYIMDGIGKLTSGFTCVDSKGVRFNTKALRLQLSHLIRKCLAKYHDGYMKCADDTCAHRTRNVVCDVYRDGQSDTGEFGAKCPVQGCAGKMRVEFTSEMLYLQLLYLKQLFDVAAANRKLHEENSDRKDRNLMPLAPPVMSDDDRATLEVLQQDCASALRDSAYNIVDLGGLFNLNTDNDMEVE